MDQLDRENVVSLAHIDAIRQNQEASGRTVVEISPDTRPLRDIEGFDSYSGVEAALFLSDLLDREIPDEVFVPEKGRRILTVSEIADNVAPCEQVGVRSKSR